MKPQSMGRIRTSTTDVIIVGAGPSGLMAAQALGRLGIDVTVVERRIPGQTYGNADGLQPRTLEIWKTYGILETIESKGARMIGMVAYEQTEDGQGLVRLRPSHNIAVPSRYPYEITASISDIEGTLRMNADESNVKFKHNSWPISLEITNSTDPNSDSDFPVKMTVREGIEGCGPYMRESSDQPTNEVESLELMSAKYVIGADGAYSWIRRASNISMEGEQTEDVWGVVDVLVDTDFPDLRFKCIIQGKSGPLIVIPREGDKVRIYIQMSTVDKIPRRSDGRLDKSSLSHIDMLDRILQQIRHRLSPYRVEFTEIFWSTIFSTAQKVASSFSVDNRVFIVGDACHTHSPKAGQGANASMGDAHNLAWKLAYVIRGWARPSILYSYEQERREYAMNLIAFDKEISTSLDGRAALEYQKMLHKQAMFTSGMGINYSSSTLTVNLKLHTNDSQVSPGDRFPSAPIIRIADWKSFDAQDLLPADGNFKLVVLPGSLIQTSSQAILQDFAVQLQQALKSSYLKSGHKSGIASRLKIYTVASDIKEDITWKHVPSQIAESWRCCFTTRRSVREEMGEDLYKQFGLTSGSKNAETLKTGMAVLVRPDGYISMIIGMADKDAGHIVSFLCSL